MCAAIIERISVDVNAIEASKLSAVIVENRKLNVLCNNRLLKHADFLLNKQKKQLKIRTLPSMIDFGVSDQKRASPK